MFERIMNSPCQNHGFIVTHLKVQEAEKRMDQEGYSRDSEDDQGSDATARSSMLIFGGPQAY
jgi:hypothetical protein